MASSGVAEFQESKLDEFIIEKLLKWYCGIFNSAQKPYVEIPESLGLSIENSLEKTNRRMLANLLNKALSCDELDKQHKYLIGGLLGRYEPNSEMLNALLKEQTLEFSESLNKELRGSVDSEGKLENTSDECDVLHKLQVHVKALMLLSVEPENQIAKDIIERATLSKEDNNEGFKEVETDAFKLLSKFIDHIHSLAVLSNEQDFDSLLSINLELENVDNIDAIIQQIYTEDDELMLYCLVSKLGESGLVNEQIVLALLHLITTKESQDVRLKACCRLQEALNANTFLLAVPRLKLHLHEKKFAETAISSLEYTLCSDMLWQCAENMSYPEFYEAWHSPLPDGSKPDAVGYE